MKSTTNNISRRGAIKKMGYGALTASTMMTILNGNAQENWGNWDDVNLKSTAATTNGPAASPDIPPVSNELPVHLEVDVYPGNPNYINLFVVNDDDATLAGDVYSFITYSPGGSKQGTNQSWMAPGARRQIDSLTAVTLPTSVTVNFTFSGDARLKTDTYYF